MARGWVEAGDVAPALAALSVLLADTDSVQRLQGRLHLFIDGYEDDARELWMIPEVRTYVRALDAQFPSWLWFMDPHDPTVLLFVLCCCDVADYQVAGDRFSAAVYPAFLAPFLTRHLEAVDELARRSAIPEPTLRSFMNSVLDRFGVPRGTTDGRAPFN